MISQRDFEDELRALQIDPRPLGSLVTDPANASHFVVAGPGTGKTTALAIRALKLVLVEDVDPGSIVATTFTRRAAAELRSRILQRADAIRRSLLGRVSEPVRRRLASTDFNRIKTGTLDSLSEEILTDFRALGSPPPVVIDEHYANALMLRFGLFASGRFREPALRAYAALLNGTAWGLNPASLSGLVRELHDRSLYDRVDLQAYRNSGIHPGVSYVVDAIDDYRAYLQNAGLFDFGLLENHFYQELTAGRLQRFTQEVRVLLVDEYQDTNYLQELIYFELARLAIAASGGITVVGDDDQALFRFRGATTDLFINFPLRIHQAIAVRPTIIYLTENRRSTDDILAIVNTFATLDSRYAQLRVANKPPVVRRRVGAQRFPILGMFRSDLQALTADLSRLIDGVVNGQGYRIPGHSLVIQRDPAAGSAADVIFLASSPAEYSASGPLLPNTLRSALAQLHRPIQMYNPRGQALRLIPEVGQLLGLCLDCIDPQNVGLQVAPNLPRDAVAEFQRWRQMAGALVQQNPHSQQPLSLRDFVSGWQARRPIGQVARWPREASILELIYKLITWIPYFQTDLEGLAYLETINRTATGAANLSRYEANILTGPQAGQVDFQRSLADLYWNFFEPLALDLMEVDEDLLDTLPSDRLGVFSIHQAKGLEFPLVIVDVGSSFRSKHHSHAFKRFPRDEGRSSRIENNLRRFSPLGVPVRSGIDRCFDDLIRQYFVAYSRAQDVLLLVGLDGISGVPGIPHVATGWDRQNTWHWNGLSNILML